jgi:hypothetical protein
LPPKIALYFLSPSTPFPPPVHPPPFGPTFSDFPFISRPPPFHETWTANLNRNPDRQLRNANDLFIPAHHFASVRRFPLFTFPRAWNDEPERKFIPSHKIYCKQLKAALLESLVD